MVLSPLAHRLARIAAVMVEYEVDFVVVGGFAIEVQMAADGTSVPYPPTQDIDIAPSRGLANLERLVAALETLDAGIRTEVGRFEMRHVAEDFRGTGLRNFTCEYGDFDLAFEPGDGPQRAGDHRPVVQPVCAQTFRAGGNRGDSGRHVVGERIYHIYVPGQAIRVPVERDRCATDYQEVNRHSPGSELRVEGSEKVADLTRA